MEEKKELKSEAGDRFLSSEPGFRGIPKACDLFPARGQNASRVEFGVETRAIPTTCDRFPARGQNASRLQFGGGNSANVIETRHADRFYFQVDLWE